MNRTGVTSAVLIICAMIAYGCGGSGTTNGGGGTTVTLTSLSLVKLDGTEMELSATPVPRKVGVKYTLSAAVESADDRTAFESSVSLLDGADQVVPGSYEWATDYTSVTFTPTRNLEYRTEYTVMVPTTETTASLAKAVTGPQSFTTMVMGDANGDGYADPIVGAAVMPTGTNEGRAFIFHGSASGIADRDLSATTADTTISANGASWLGVSVSVRGDVNGDGYADAIVGGSIAAGGGTNRGEAYVFLGSASGIADCDLSSSTSCAHAVLSGASDMSYFGQSSGFAGDVNGDGYDDIIVGAYLHQTSPGVNPGQAYVFLGGPSLAGELSAASDAAVTITGDANADFFGASVAGAGDVNGDGYDDIVISGTGISPYYAVIFHGGASMAANMTPSADAATRLQGDGAADDFGYSVYTAGDVNGDGYDDVIVGAYKASYGAVTGGGRAYIYHGSADGVADCDIAAVPTCPNAILSGAANDDYLGTSVAAAGDVNGDGYDDVLAGADHDKPGGLGYAYIFAGSASGVATCDMSTTPTCPATSFTGGAADDFLGRSVSGAGDVNGDGFDDVIMTAPTADGAGTDRGQAYVFVGASAGIADCNLASCGADTTITGAVNDDRLGSSVR